MPGTAIGLRRFLFVCFVLSGASSLIAQVVWLRLTAASFGVTTPVLALLLSIFMAGLALGSHAAGVVSRRASAAGALRAYGAAEAAIALSAFVVPALLASGRRLLAGAGAGEWGSALYHLGVGGWLGLVLLPFCAAMGATLPLALAALRAAEGAPPADGFSRLYVANVVGATLGTVTAALVLIETLGLRGALVAGAALNAAIAVAAWLRAPRESAGAGGASPPPAPPAFEPGTAERRRTLALLFATGFASLGMEVIWIRLYTPHLGNLVYSFATILTIYLAATFVGAALYRRSRRKVERTAETTSAPPSPAPPVAPAAWAALLVAAMLPLAFADVRMQLLPPVFHNVLRALFGLTPFCLLLGALTPRLVDRLTGGDAARAGGAYAINVVGGILGPLVAGFLLVPRYSESISLFALGALPLAVALWPAGERSPGRALLPAAVGLAGAAALLVSTKSFEQVLPGATIRRDATGTVAAWGQGMDKHITVNGIGMTYLTPITKVMAHLPLAFVESPPTKGLVICFGMGTSFRSMASWGIETTAVELVPSVPELFGEFHADGPQLLRSPRSRVVIDDGRRFLEYGDERYDVIVLDPPPPIEAASSSLLYSMEFYAAAKRRLAPGGIVQQWIPAAEPEVLAAMLRAFDLSFPGSRVFRSVEGWGYHLLGSESPIRPRSAAELAARLPAAARADLVEWGPDPQPEAIFDRMLRSERPIARILGSYAAQPPLVDDRPVNEYFALRRLARGWRG